MRVDAGGSFRIVDVDGGQVADLFAFSLGDPGEHLSAGHTRAELFRLFPAIGEPFVTNRRRPILMLEADTSPGIHDMLFAACDAARYASLGEPPGHASCEENLRAAVSSAGFGPVGLPQPVNLFENTTVRSDGSLDWKPATTKPGDYVQLRAEQDCLVVVSACPYDLEPVRSVGALAIDLL